MFRKARHELIDALENVKEGLDSKVNRVSLKLVRNSRALVDDDGVDDTMDEELGGKSISSKMAYFKTFNVQNEGSFVSKGIS